MGDLEGGFAVGTASDDASKDVLKFRKAIKQGQAHYTDWRKKATQYYKVYGGNAWPDDVREYMEREGRPPVDFNWALSTINTFVGKEMSDRKEVQFRSHKVEDLLALTAADMRTKLVRFWTERSDAQRHESQAILDCAITGYGWNEVFVDDNDWPFRPRPQHVDPWEIFADPKAKDDNLTDARWIIRQRDMTMEEIKIRWPGKERDLNQYGDIAVGDSLYPLQAKSDYVDDERPDVRESTVKVWEFQYVEYVKHVVYKDLETNQSVVVTEKEFKEYMKSMQLMGGGQQAPQMDVFEFPKKCYYRAFYAGGLNSQTVTLQKPEKLETDSFTYCCITGFREKDLDRGTTKFFGIMHLAYQPQLVANKILSSIIEMLARNSKGGGFFTRGAVAHPDRFAEDIARTGAWIEVLDIEGVVERKPMAWPQALDMMMHFAISAIPQVTNISEFDKGTSTRERSEVLISNYQQQSDIVMAVLRDPINGFRIQMGRLMSSFIENYVSDEDIDSILSEPVIGVTHEEVPNEETGEVELQEIMKPSALLRDQSLRMFDTAVDIGQASPTERQHLWSILTDTGLLTQMIEWQLPIDKLIVKFIKLLPINPDLAIEMANEMAQEMEQQKQMQTVEGMAQVVAGWSPEEIMQFVQTVGPVVDKAMQKQQQQQQQQQQGPPQQGPPQQ